MNNSDGCSGGAMHSGGGHSAALRPTEWLALSAAPTFAFMALLTGIPGGGKGDVLCASTQDMLPLGGMAAMYLLMSAFHSAPWLKLISSRRSGSRTA